jgi:uncharacterized RDD family membrane protein YckC
MTEQHLTPTVSSIESPAWRMMPNQAIQQVGRVLLVLLIMSAIWVAATGFLVFLLADSWSFSPRLS